jgi:hypothetical protein
MAARPPAVIRSTKSAADGTEDRRKEACRQSIMILQHEDTRADALELAFHGGRYNNFLRLRQRSMAAI